MSEEKLVHYAYLLAEQMLAKNPDSELVKELEELVARIRAELDED